MSEKVKELSNRYNSVVNIVRERQAKEGNKMMERNGLRRTKFQNGDEVMVEIEKILFTLFYKYNSFIESKKEIRYDLLFC